MPEPLQFTKAEHGWAATMPREMALAAGVAEGSLIVLHLEDGTFLSLKSCRPPRQR